MKRALGKKSAEKEEKRKKTKDKPAQSRPASKEMQGDQCKNCSKDLVGADRALFVEEEVGRVFCSESCIAGYFSPEIERLEKEYFRKLSPNDLSGDERESLSHLRWITLQEPDEVWREKTLSGDHRFTLISEFQPESRKIWCICICLFLRGEPSFLYLAFSTRNTAMANHYRKGERVQLIKNDDSSDPTEQGMAMDGLAEAWTEDETLRAKLGMERKSDDIPTEDFSHYQSCLEQTLEVPDEVWSLKVNGKHQTRLYHFIRSYPEENTGIWYIVVAREIEDEEQIEILDAFPTRDADLVECYRQGHQELASLDPHSSVVRVVH